MPLVQPDICSAVQAHSLATPDKPFHIFVRDGQRSVFSFADLWQLSGRVASALVTRGVGSGDLVIVSMPMGPELIASFLGAMRIAAVPSIMPYPNVKQKNELFWGTHSTLFERIEPAAFVLSGRIAELYDEHLPHLSSRIVRTEELPPLDPAAHHPMADIDPSAVAFLQHSSGTTALKKGVKLTHAVVVDHVHGYAKACGIDASSRIFSWLPLYHDMGLISCLIMPMVIGCTVTAMDNFEWVARPLTMLQVMDEDRLEFAWMPNFGFAHLVRACADPSRYDLSSVKALINCSEPCRPETHARFISHFAPAGLEANTLQVCYAMAENVFAVSQTDFDRPVRALSLSTAGFDHGKAREAEAGEVTIAVASCGKPLPNVTISIVDEERRPLAPGSVGEIAITSSSLFNGYNRRDDLTAKALAEGTYYTGDLGFILDDELFLTGRKDDLILAYGRNLLAHELEAIVNEVPGVKPGRLVVFDVFSPQAGSNVVIVMAETLAEANHAEVSRLVRQALDAGAGISPQQVILLADGDLIKTTSGKISRPRNRQAYLDQINRSSNS